MPADSSDLTQPLEEADWDRLGAILDSLGDRAELDVEGLDGLLAANACGPRQMRPLTVLATAFADGEMPEFANQADFQDFLSLSMRRSNEYVKFFGVDRDQVAPGNIVLPVLFEVNEEDMALAREWTPDAETARRVDRRPGRWLGQAWARGFLRAQRAYPDPWQQLIDSKDGWELVVPLLLLDLGYNPDQPDRPFDPEQWIVMMPLVLRDIDRFFRAAYLKETQPRQSRRPMPKIGRNNPCPCGSGRKYKRCCGANA